MLCFTYCFYVNTFSLRMEHRPMRMKLLGPQLCMESYEIKNEMDFVLHFLPVTYIKNVLIPATNAYAKKSITSWKDMDFDEFLHVIEIFLAMEVS